MNNDPPSTHSTSEVLRSFMVFKLLLGAERRWRKINAPHWLLWFKQVHSSFGARYLPAE